MKLTSVFAREIIDSRGNPTIEVDVRSEKGFGRGSAPSGASRGIYEAVELRDGGERYLGKGVKNAVENVNKKIAKALVGKELKDQRDADERMLKLDGTKNKSRLGGNSITATSIAIMRAFANSENKQVYEYVGEIYGNSQFKIPQPMFNILNGGKHAGNKLSIQEFMITPRGKTFSETLQMASEIYHVLGKILVDMYGPSARNVGDEGGYSPPIDKTETAFDVIIKAIEGCGYSKTTSLAIDCAASSFYDDITKTYYIDGKGISGEMLKRYYLDFLKRYPIASIEDPFNEDDLELFSALTSEVGVMIIGDDLLVTNPQRIKQAIEKKCCNALLLKINQIGTVSEAMDGAKLATSAQWKVIASHRSGETEDTVLSEFAVGIGAEYLKAGAPARGERTAKYNALLRLEEKGLRMATF